MAAGAATGPIGLGEKNQKKKPSGAFFSMVGPGGVTGYVWLRAPTAWECGTSSDGTQTGTDRDGEREAAVMTGRREKPRGLTKSKEKLIFAESFLFSLSLSLQCVKNLKKVSKVFFALTPEVQTRTTISVSVRMVSGCKTDLIWTDLGGLLRSVGCWCLFVV